MSNNNGESEELGFCGEGEEVELESATRQQQSRK